MKRRDFLKATLVSAGSLFVAACGGGSDKGGSDADAGAGGMGGSGGMGGGGMGGTGGMGGMGGGPCDDRMPQDGAQYFPQSLMSGDPRPDGVILWTRVEDAARADADVPVELQIALDPQFAQCVTLDGGATRALTATATFDHCVKARVTGLSPATVYYYRFLVQVGDQWFTTRTARTKTAPAADADVPVKFAYVSCQDFNGRYYNAYRHLGTMDVDFVVHLGDYVYETTGDPSFQDITADRRVQFRNPEEAIVFNQGTPSEYYAAKSLGNYRDLYRTIRSDADLQKVHEQTPMIAIWDDHEFSDDCHGATATYTDGREDETDVARRKAADQAWFEYMPTDYAGQPDFRYDPAAAFPGDLKIYRDLQFGRHVHLILTDLRTWRSDHLVPEDAFPGAIALTQDEVEATRGEVPDFCDAYVDIAMYQGGMYAGVLRDAGVADAHLQGNVSVEYINGVVGRANMDRGADMQIPAIDGAGLPRGLAWRNVFKLNDFGSVGSRYLVLAEPFRLLADARFAATDGASETAMGDEQEAWFLDKVQRSDRTWKLWANEYTLTPRKVDLRNVAAAPPPFNQVFLLSAEDWDGLPNRRQRIVHALGAVQNVVALTGDIHAFFAGTPRSEMDPTRQIVELVGGAITSGTYLTLLTRQAMSDPSLPPAAVGLAAAVEFFMTDPMAKPNPTLAFAKVSQHGFVTVTVDGTQLLATFHRIDEDKAKTRFDGDDAGLARLFTTSDFKVDAGSKDLQMKVGDAWKRWDPDAYAWV